ncbi:MAG: glycosyltransferase family 2 protein [Gammaproteobacteria bacterium]|nr:glycosyltransferase family 2 protein [Gammaproteobacteria bacterium]
MSQAISVVLPNYNGRHLLEKNMPSLLQSLEGLEHEIIVVDDCSADDSVLFLHSTYPDIRLIQNETNLGFSSTCNKGIYAARLELLCVVNTDVTFTQDYFTKSIKEFDDSPLFAVKGDIINYDRSFEDVISIDRTTLLYYKRGFLRFDTRTPLTQRTLIQNNDAQFVGLGCCFVCNREMLLELGGFDEIYSPFYWEDCDLGRRAMEKGFKLLYLPDAKVYHQASSTIGSYRSNNLRRLVSNRNKFLFTWRNLDKKRLWLSHTPITVLNLLTRWIILDWKYYAAFFWAIQRRLKFS